MYQNEELYIAHSDKRIVMQGKMANRHGLIAGATGTGKTVTLQVIAETFSQAGVPCFMADMKGDLSGISQAGQMSGFIEKRKDEFEVPNPDFEGCPVRFFDVFGKQGHPLRMKIGDMDSVLLARMLELNETQAGVLNIAMKVAADKKAENENDPAWDIIDLKDLKMLLNYVGDHAKEFTVQYGNISTQSVGAIQRALLAIETQGGDKFFGEPALDVTELIAKKGGKGIMSVLAADELFTKPKLYSSFLFCLLNQIYNRLPEVGDQPLPKLIFFFDEAHTLFADASAAVLESVERIVRLIRSKGVGIYFITQNPADIPDNILGQLGNRVQHALRAFTPKDQKGVKAAAQTFRANPAFKTEDAIQNLGTGEALVSFLDEKGAPMMVEQAKILFPLSQIGAITPEQRTASIQNSDIYGEYEKAKDRESIYETLLALQEAEEKAKAEEAAAKEAEKQAAIEAKAKEKAEKEAAKQKEKEEREKEKEAKKKKSMIMKIITFLGIPAIIRSIIRGFVTGNKKKR